MAVVLAGLFLVITAYAVFNPFAGLLGLLAADMLRPGELYPSIAFLHVERILAIVLLLSVMFRPNRLAWPPITKALLIFWGAMFASVPLSIWRPDALNNAVNFGRIVLYHVLIVNLVTTEKRYRAVLLVYTLLIGWLVASSLYAFSQGIIYHGTESVERVEALNSFGGNPNSLGTTMVISIPLIWLLATKGSGVFTRLLSIGVIAGCIGTVIYTGSRTSYLALFFMILVMPFLRKKRLIYAPMALALIAIIWIATPQDYKDRYLSVTERNKDLSYINRLKSWDAGWHMFLDNPLTGVGVGEYGNANGMKYWPDPGHRIWLGAHSLYFQCIAELGIIGAGSFLFFLYRFFRLNAELTRRFDEELSWSSAVRHFPSACNLILLSLLFAGYSGHDLYRTMWYLMAGLAGALQLMAVQPELAPAVDELPAPLWAQAR